MTPDEARALRLRCKLSQRALARLLGVHFLTVWRAEHGRRRISPTYAVKLTVLALKLRPHTRHLCPTCRGMGVVNGHMQGICQTGFDRVTEKEREPNEE
jgi:DNA-binding XRE family transcriptional regulator